MRKKQTPLALFLSFLLLCGAIFPVGCAKKQFYARSHTFYGYFDTVCAVYVYSDLTDGEFTALTEEIDARLAHYQALFDLYDEGSDVGRINGKDAAITVDPETYELLAFAKDYAMRTGGAVNVAFGAVLSLWHEARERNDNTLPDPAALEEAAKHVDVGNLVLYENGAARLTDPEASLDLGAFAKGFVADKLAAYIESLGYTGIALDLGGNLRVVGEKAEGVPFTVAIRDPQNDGEYVAKIPLSDAALVTSGISERYFTVDGVRYGHIISPETLYPNREFLQVSVLSPSAADADALSTALFNLPLADGQALIAATEGTEALWILADGSLVYSDGFPH